MVKTAKELTTTKLSLLLNEIAKYYEIDNIYFADKGKYVSLKTKKDEKCEDEYILVVNFLRPMKTSTKQVILNFLNKNINFLYKKKSVFDKERNLVSFLKRKISSYVVEDPFKDKVLN
jgi:hypothetical protein